MENKKKMKFTVITLFPELIEKYFEFGVVGKALEKELIDLNTVDLREFGLGKHKQVDDKAFGGGAGMVLRFEPIEKAINSARKANTKELVIATSAKGEIFDQPKVKSLGEKYDHIIILAGRYEGFDQRILDQLVDLEISIGQFVLSNGDLPALVVIDSIARLIPGVLGKEESFQTDSHFEEPGKLQHPQYTRPEVIEYNGKKLKVPPTLLSGNHADIERWREENSSEVV